MVTIFYVYGISLALIFILSGNTIFKEIDKLAREEEGIIPFNFLKYSLTAISMLLLPITCLWVIEEKIQNLFKR